jgi:antitoxin (DNA-binding transcriptional repressor) of toxin-antitoxin stability system
MEKLVALKELRLNMDKYSKEVQSGKSFIVLKQSKPLFKISPVENEGGWEEIINFAKIKKGGVNIDELLKAL